MNGKKADIILGIESSCDDTSAAVLRDEYLLSSVIASQKVHEKWGGVVPELASRAHLMNIVPVVDQALEQAGVTMDDVSAIAFTRGPGLLGSLLVGTSYAKGLAIATGKPLVEVNHLQGHILSCLVKEEGKEKRKRMTRTKEGGGRMRKKERREQEGKRMFAQKAVRDSSQLLYL